MQEDKSGRIIGQVRPLQEMILEFTQIITVSTQKSPLTADKSSVHTGYGYR